MLKFTTVKIRLQIKLNKLGDGPFGPVI